MWVSYKIQGDDDRGQKYTTYYYLMEHDFLNKKINIKINPNRI